MKFTKLNIGDVVASSGTRCFKRLTTDEPIVGGYLTFSSPSAFTLKTYNSKKNWDGVLEYSTDTKTWNKWGGTTISADSGVLYMRGTGNTKITGDSSKYSWVLNGTDIYCTGNIENILDYATVSRGENPTMANYCYYYMFQNCTGLKTAPELPATTLATSCYAYMFWCCTSLTTAPALPATTLATSCYRYMFSDCTSLTTAPALPATTLAYECYYCMFGDCTSLTTAPALPATTLAERCYLHMFSGCTSLTTAPALPATTLAKKCYDCMFWCCTSLTTIPALPATTLAYECYKEMFRACENIKISTTKTSEYQIPYRIPTIGTGTSAEYAFFSMFYKTGGTFTSDPSINKTYYTSNTVV